MKSTAVAWRLLRAFFPDASLAKSVEISSLQALAAYAGQRGNTLAMKPGLNKLIDSLPLELLPAESAMNVHALATIHGAGHPVASKPSKQGERTRSLRILIGHGTPAAGEGMAPIPEQPTRNVILRNETTMPVEIGPRASECEISTRGPVRENRGRDNSIKEFK